MRGISTSKVITSGRSCTMFFGKERLAQVEELVATG
jgi:2-hydroxychromene-2-carboxylate isomerase